MNILTNKEDTISRQDWLNVLSIESPSNSATAENVGPKISAVSPISHTAFPYFCAWVSVKMFGGVCRGGSSRGSGIRREP
jgi:hypothetical protein